MPIVTSGKPQLEFSACTRASISFSNLSLDSDIRHASSLLVNNADNELTSTKIWASDSYVTYVPLAQTSLILTLQLSKFTSSSDTANVGADSGVLALAIVEGGRARSMHMVAIVEILSSQLRGKDGKSTGRSQLRKVERTGGDT